LYGNLLLAQAHLARAIDDEVDLLLLLVVPRHLSAIGLERYIAHGEVGGLNGTGAAHQVLRAPASRIRAPGDLREIGNDHRTSTLAWDADSQPSGRAGSVYRPID